MLAVSPRRVSTMIAAAAALVAGSLALSAPAFADAATGGSAASAPALGSPAAGANVAAFSPITFSWSGPAGAVYLFEDSSSPATDASGAFAVADGGQQVLTETHTVFPPTGVAQTRFWHVGTQTPDGVAWSGVRQVVFGTQAPDAGVGTPVTVTAPAGHAAAPPVTTTQPAPASPKAAQSTPAQSTPAESTAAQPAAPPTAEPAPAPTPSTPETSSSPTRSSEPQVHSQRTAAVTASGATDPAAIPLALSGSLGAALLLFAVVRLVRFRRQSRG